MHFQNSPQPACRDILLEWPTRLLLMLTIFAGLSLTQVGIRLGAPIVVFGSWGMHKMRAMRHLATVVYTIWAMGTAQASTLDGLTAATAATSAKQLQTDSGFTASSGNFFVDPDGPGGNDPVQTTFDQSTEGGGWTLALVTLQPVGLVDGTSSLSLTSNVGTFDGGEFSLDVSALTSGQLAEYRFDFIVSGVLQRVILEQIFNDPDASLASQATEPFNIASSLSVFVRESITPTYSQDDMTAVPLPAAGWLLLLSFGGLAFLRRRGS